MSKPTCLSLEPTFHWGYLCSPALLRYPRFVYVYPCKLLVSYPKHRSWYTLYIWEVAPAPAEPNLEEHLQELCRILRVHGGSRRVGKVGPKKPDQFTWDVSAEIHQVKNKERFQEEFGSEADDSLVTWHNDVCVCVSWHLLITGIYWLHFELQLGLPRWHIHNMSFRN